MSRIRVDKNNRKYIIKLLQFGDLIMKKIVSVMIIFILLLPLAAVAENGILERGLIGDAKRDTFPYGKANDEMSVNISGEISGEEALEEQSNADIYGNASGFDRFMIGFMFVILSFSALCMPIYIVLDLKKRRERRTATGEKSEDTDMQNEDCKKGEQ